MDRSGRALTNGADIIVDFLVRQNVPCWQTRPMRIVSSAPLLNSICM